MPCARLCANLPTCQEPYCDCISVLYSTPGELEEQRIERERTLGVSVLSFPCEEEEEEEEDYTY